MRKLVLGLCGAAALTMATSANASVTITWGNPPAAVPGNNDFQSDLAGLGLTQYASTGADIVLNADAVLSFEFLGSESGFDDTFQAGAVNYSEYTSFTPWGSLAIGADSFSAGSLIGLLNFSSLGGANATVGDDGFGIFLGPNDVSGLTTNVFYIGYDDQITNIDDNHDDMIIRVTVSPAVPEPATWAMMLVGFGAAGFAIRRRRRVPLLTQAA